MTETRATTAYPCATFGCDNPGVGVETRPVQASVGFYGYCAKHDPNQEGGRWAQSK